MRANRTTATTNCVLICIRYETHTFSCYNNRRDGARTMDRCLYILLKLFEWSFIYVYSKQLTFAHIGPISEVASFAHASSSGAPAVLVAVALACLSLPATFKNSLFLENHIHSEEYTQHAIWIITKRTKA